ncbi:MAG: LL-diaminopimelate aminotransferase [Elusimicrobiota bacterium]|nr:LL-diaminopimelate aminotransferase [Elusimicrobiota bacterium]MDH5661515.1 LL-diaminopimelate aminotransferase [Elusimicrobiota bacterium]
MRCAEKLNKLPPYLFGAINALKEEAYARKQDVIDMGMGNPDMATPSHIVERLCDTIKNHPRTHRYPQAKGMPKFRKAVADWYGKKFKVKLDPESEVLALIGSKEGIGHMCMSYLNPGDLALVPNPAYLIHRNGVILGGGEVYDLPILPEKNYLPELEKIPTKVAKQAKLMFLNYPNNPTTAVVEDISFFKEVVAFAKKYDIIVCHDFAYSEITFDGFKPPSFLEVPGAKAVAVEFHSFSKTYNMAGWRLGFCVGNREILRPLERLKSYLDFGVFTAIQLAGVLALSASQKCVQDAVAEYERRRDKFVDGLNRIGWKVEKPKATMYIWAKLPEKFAGMSSLQFAELLIERTGIAVAPGIAFGSYGEGFVRMALVTHYNRFHDALLRLKKFLKEGPPHRGGARARSR